MKSQKGNKIHGSGTAVYVCAGSIFVISPASVRACPHERKFAGQRTVNGCAVSWGKSIEI